MADWDEYISPDKVDFSRIGVEFVKDRLGINSSLLENGKPDLALLQSIAENYETKIPWHNLSLLATPHNERRLPTAAEIVDAATSGQGGLCYTMNVFMKWLLGNLGYDVDFLPSTVLTQQLGIHITILANSVTSPESRHFVDVGMGYIGFPILEFPPVQLSASARGSWKSPEYQSLLCKCQIMTTADPVIVERIHRYPIDVPYESAKNKVVTYCKYDLSVDPSFQFFKNVLENNVYCGRSPGTSRLLYAARVVRMHPTDGFFAFNRNKYLLAKEGGGLATLSAGSTADSWKQVIHDKMEMIDLGTVSRAIDDVYDISKES